MYALYNVKKDCIFRHAPRSLRFLTIFSEIFCQRISLQKYIIFKFRLNNVNIYVCIYE